MKKYSVELFLFFLSFVFLISGAEASESKEKFYKEIADRFANERPKEWGMELDGIFRGIETTEKAVALTFDACGSSRQSDGFDKGLIDFLKAEKVHATLFINERWIKQHPEEFAELASEPLFEIGSHGTEHRPLCVTGRSAYKITGTQNAAEAVKEVVTNLDTIEALTGKRPAFSRAGTAHYDDVAVRIVAALGCKVAGFSVNGDCGATLKASEVEKNYLSVKPGDIVLSHMNHPEKGTRDGVKAAIPQLKALGFRFVTLSELASK